MLGVVVADDLLDFDLDDLELLELEDLDDFEDELEALFIVKVLSLESIITAGTVSLGTKLGYLAEIL